MCAIYSPNAMNKPNDIELLLLRSKVKKPFELQVAGTSMLPVLRHGDTVTVCRKDDYEVGDILVFIYKNGEVLVHRLLAVENGRFFCKGDNSFRVEDIDAGHIVGAVMLEHDQHRGVDFIAASRAVGRAFRRCGYDITKTISTHEYQTYRQKYLENTHEIHKE